MPRRLKLPTRELGAIELQVVYETDGVWETAWRPLQGHPIASLFTVISKEVYDHALIGWTKPIVDALGLSPEGALKKLPDEAKQCEVRGRCPFYTPRDCRPEAKKMPWCYEPDGIEDALTRNLAADAIKLWREKVYVVVVQEST